MITNKRKRMKIPSKIMRLVMEIKMKSKKMTTNNQVNPVLIVKKTKKNLTKIRKMVINQIK